jgi:uridine phosphorylase
LPWIFERDRGSSIPLLAELGGAPPYVIVVGDRRRARRILGRLDEALNLTRHCETKIGAIAAGRVELGVGRTDGVPVMVVESQMGGSATEIIVREVLDRSFHPGGARAVLRVGSCGTLGALDAMPVLAIARFATGWSAAIEQWRRGVLAPPGEHGGGDSDRPPVVACTPAVVEALTAAAATVAPGVRVGTGGIFSKDSLYSEQDDRFAAILESLGCIATEMELSTIGPLAEWMGVAWGGIMASAGRVPDGPWLEPDAIVVNEDLAIGAALAAIRRLAAAGSRS